jgi:hypothetical protein
VIRQLKIIIKHYEMGIVGGIRQPIHHAGTEKNTRKVRSTYDCRGNSPKIPNQSGITIVYEH